MIEKGVGQRLGRHSLGIQSGLPPGVQVITLFQVFGQGTVRIGPGAEVVNLTSDSLSPVAGGVSVEWKVRVRLGGFALNWSGGRILSSHDNGSSEQALLWPRPGRHHRPGHCSKDTRRRNGRKGKRIWAKK